VVKGLHPALQGLLTLIPAKPGGWSGRAAFDGAWKSTLDVLYPIPSADSGKNGKSEGG
jgi:hypothetical protein